MKPIIIMNHTGFCRGHCI